MFLDGVDFIVDTTLIFSHKVVYRKIIFLSRHHGTKTILVQKIIRRPVGRDNRRSVDRRRLTGGVAIDHRGT